MSKFIPIQQAGGPIIFRQLFESLTSTYTYLIADRKTKEAILIDPVYETVDRDAKLKYNAQADVKLEHNHKISFGDFNLLAKSTPGHTDGCLTFVFPEGGVAFTGDALLIRGCGRTDFQDGDAGLLYDKIHAEILSLDEDYLLFPAHDYSGATVTSVAEEKKYNPRLTKTKDEFIKIMNNLGLAKPLQIENAVPANLKCGIFGDGDSST